MKETTILSLFRDSPLGKGYISLARDNGFILCVIVFGQHLVFDRAFWRTVICGCCEISPQILKPALAGTAAIGIVVSLQVSAHIDPAKGLYLIMFKNAQKDFKRTGVPEGRIKSA